MKRIVSESGSPLQSDRPEKSARKKKGRMRGKKGGQEGRYSKKRGEEGRKEKRPFTRLKSDFGGSCFRGVFFGNRAYLCTQLRKSRFGKVQRGAKKRDSVERGGQGPGGPQASVPGFSDFLARGEKSGASEEGGAEGGGERAQRT